MMNLINRFFKRLFTSSVLPYGPALLTLVFAVVLVHFFPEGPIWPVGAFFIFMIFIFSRYIK
ncbi:hypothetical protein SIL11_01945 [Scandinavium sp. V105_1]|uniref:Phosphatidylglycerophosphatase A n=1 Tax=Scandinavium lactucae TaxID=3095028 RepID=A0ABU4QKW1_9ENTR|nr:MULTISPECIES: hypothetical protein [unclassified Scandinavium]MDX6039472.1 hypothetical protein [Scandinavium sp. V105_6]MDX6048934.1 hypothetical protein [Scandinavium sp. V105_1]